MCEDILHTEEKHCLEKTIKTVLKSIERGEKKLRKLFKDEEPKKKNNGLNHNSKNIRSTS